MNIAWFSSKASWMPWLKVKKRLARRLKQLKKEEHQLKLADEEIQRTEKAYELVKQGLRSAQPVSSTSR